MAQFMAPQARPTGEYESIDNENRNMYEMVSLKNGSEGPIVMVMRDDRGNKVSYGTLEAGETKNVPKFVGEHYMSRNSLVKIVDGGDPEATRAIEADQEVLMSTEQSEVVKAKAAMAQRKEAKKAQAESLATVAEGMAAEAETIPDDEPSSDEEIAGHFDKHATK